MNELYGEKDWEKNTCGIKNANLLLQLEIKPKVKDSTSYQLHYVHSPDTDLVIFEQCLWVSILYL